MSSDFCLTRDLRDGDTIYVNAKMAPKVKFNMLFCCLGQLMSGVYWRDLVINIQVMKDAETLWNALRFL